jgi:hypothetical protein
MRRLAELYRAGADGPATDDTVDRLFRLYSDADDGARARRGTGLRARVGAATRAVRRRGEAR